MTVDLTDAAQDIVLMGQKAAQRGWVVATGGNFSVRVDAARFAITRSGVEKGELTAADVLHASINGDFPTNASAETAIHACIYEHLPHAGAIVHVHSPAAIMLSRITAARHVRLSGYELLKAIEGITTHDITVDVPLLPNSQNMTTITTQLAPLLQRRDVFPAFLLASHGLTVWGRDARAAFKHAEALEFLFGLELEHRRLS